MVAAGLLGPNLVISALEKAPSSFGRPRRVEVEVGGVCRDQKLDRHGSEGDKEASKNRTLQQPGTRSAPRNDAFQAPRHPCTRSLSHKGHFHILKSMSH